MLIFWSGEWMLPSEQQFHLTVWSHWVKNELPHVPVFSSYCVCSLNLNVCVVVFHQYILALSLALVVSEKLGWYRPSCCSSSDGRGGGSSGTTIRTSVAGGDGINVLSLPPHRLPSLLIIPLSDQLVVFHQFFQSLIDSGLCISEASVLWPWLWHSADRKTLSHDSAVHGNTKHEAFVYNPCCFYLPALSQSKGEKLWGICQVVFLAIDWGFIFLLMVILRTRCTFQTSLISFQVVLNDWHIKCSHSGSVFLFPGRLCLFCVGHCGWRKAWHGLDLSYFNRFAVWYLPTRSW